MKHIYQHSKKTIVLYLVLIILSALAVEAGILYFTQRNYVEKSTNLFVEEVQHVIKENKDDEKSQIEEIKENYITVAKAVSYFIYDDPDTINDFKKLEYIAQLLSIDEIHIFDEEGYIVSGTSPESYGLNLDSGEQIAYFKPMLNDKNLSMAQDITPNTISGKDMMYTIVWDNKKDHMIQVGVSPDRFFSSLKKHDISSIINSIPISSGYDIYAIDPITQEVIATTNNEIAYDDPIIVNLLNNIDFDSQKVKFGYYNAHGKGYNCKVTKVDNYLLAFTYKLSAGQNNFTISLITVAVYLTIAAFAIYKLFTTAVDSEYKKNETLRQHVKEVEELNTVLTEKTDTILKQFNVLSAMANIYYSLILIDLRNDTYEIFSKDGRILDNYETVDNAFLFQKKYVNEITELKHLHAAQEFFDLNTLAERLKNKKVITGQFVSKNIGWYLALFIAVERDENGNVIKAMSAIRSIDEDKRKEEALIYQSNSDALTGLYNRRAYEQKIKEIGNDIPDHFAYIQFDVNGLKQVNDNIGHEAGDELIIGSAEIIKNSVGDYGLAYRTGGDEFVALINANQNQLEIIKNNLEINIKNWKGLLVESLTISYGIVSKDEMPLLSLQEYAKLADKRMYEAKSEHYRQKGFDRRSR